MKTLMHFVNRIYDWFLFIEIIFSMALYFVFLAIDTVFGILHLRTIAAVFAVLELICLVHILAICEYEFGCDLNEYVLGVRRLAKRFKVSDSVSQSYIELVMKTYKAFVGA